MNVLVVYAHPSKDSLCAKLYEAVCDEVTRAQHALRTHDLIAEKFDPVFSAYERVNHVGDLEQKLTQMPELRPYVENLQWCDTLILVYPTWWSGQPAVLKGWFDRVLMNGVAWTLPEGKARLSPLLTNVRRLIVVTTHGSPKWVNMVQGEPGKRTVFRSVRLMFHIRTRCTWAAVYGMDSMNDATQRERKINAVRRRVRRKLS